jgi:hypothetical protein
VQLEFTKLHTFSIKKHIHSYICSTENMHALSHNQERLH